MVKKKVKSEVSVDGDTSKRPNSIDKMIMSFLNKLWYRWPARTQTKNKVRERILDGYYKNGNEKFIYKFRCEECKELQDKVEIDHIIPKIDVQTGFTTLDDFCARFFCDVSNLQALCSSCHSAKNKEEAGIRAIFRKERKNGKD